MTTPTKQPTQQSNHISTVRAHLLDQLSAMRNAKGDNIAIELQRSKGVADIAQVIVNTAKVEIDYLRATKQTHTPFLEVLATTHTGNTPIAPTTPAAPATPSTPSTPSTPNITRNSADDIKPKTPRTNWVGMTQ